MIEDVPSLISTLGFPIAVVCYLLWERHTTTLGLKKAIENHLVTAIQELKEEIIRFSERCNGGKKVQK